MSLCHLLTLPFEIRRRIYHYIFASPISFAIYEVDRRIFSWFKKDPTYRWVVTTPPIDQMLDICRQIRAEALPELQTRLRVSCDISDRAASLDKAQIPLRGLLRNNICYLHLIAHSEYSFWPQNEMLALRHVLIESKYDIGIMLHRSSEGYLNCTASNLIDAVQSWHLDLLNEPEIPDGPGSWGLLKAISQPKRQFALEWKGHIKVISRDNSSGLSRVKTLSDALGLHFDWDSRALLAGEMQIEEMGEKDPYEFG